jgi:hypothetical protein
VGGWSQLKRSQHCQPRSITIYSKLLADNLVRLFACSQLEGPQVAFLRTTDPNTGRQGRTLHDSLILTPLKAG